MRLQPISLAKQVSGIVQICARGVGVGLICVTSLVLAVVGSADVKAASTTNAQSPLGINLASVNYYSPEQPFLNIFKTEGVSQSTPQDGWVTNSNGSWDTGEETYLQLDANGYPTTLVANSSDPHSPQLFTTLSVVLLRNLGNSNAGTGLPYRPGQYVVLYDGQGTLKYGFDASLVSSTPGRDVLNVKTPTFGGGILLQITGTDPNHTGNYIRNIRVVKAEEESLLDAGYVFRPGFLSLLQNFHALRFMSWLDTNGSALSSWSGRPLPTDGGWGTSHGVPVEVAVQLCNAVNADCWLNVPHQADNNYITQMAALVHANLGSNQKVYVEFSNEVWNYGFPQANYAQAQGQVTWPNAGALPYEYNRSWFGMRTAQMCDIWNSVWGNDASRVVCVLGAQVASAYTATESLSCPLWTGTGNAPCASHHINAVGVAPYFGGPVPVAWTLLSDGGLGNLFASLTTQNDPSVPSGGWLQQTSGWEAAYKVALAPYKLPFIAYEGGQAFVGFPTYSNGSATVNLFIAANRDSRMGAAYTTALNNWKANGGQAFMIFDDLDQPSQYGEWGALESFMDTLWPLSSAPSKWQAIQNFISGNPCWWAGCAGATNPNLATPTAPTNVQAQ